MHFLTWSRRLTPSSILLFLVACCTCPPPGTLTLDRTTAALGETVQASLEGLSAPNAAVSVAGLPAETEVLGADSLRFVVPAGAPAGPQEVLLRSDAGQAAADLIVLGEDVVPGKVTVIVAEEADEATLAALLPSSWSIERFEGLGGTGECSGQLADIDVGGTPLGEALADLEAIEADNPGLILHIDPRSSYGADAVDHLGAVSAPAAHARGRTGAGTLIAVLDTGVDEHSELEGRVRYDLGFNAVDPGDQPLDDFGSTGHGTPAAVLAAGSLSGVAPEAEIIPEKVCDNLGNCLSSDVILGVCHALNVANDEGKLDRLGVNLSLGGPTAISALEAVLAYAVEQGVLVAAAAGNEGEHGSPAHYPAAHPIPGLLAVAALAADGLDCLSFEEQKLRMQYVETDRFFDNGVAVDVEGFDAGGTPTSGFAQIDDGGLAGGTGQDLATNNVNLRPGFPYPLDGVTLEFGDYGGAINLEVNGTTLVTNGVAALPATIAGSVAVTVDADPDASTGRLTLTGPITSFAIGGQELWLDDICPLAAGALRRASFSTVGDYVDIAAPGQDLLAGTPSGVYALVEGTSFATPLVLAAAMLYRQADPVATPVDIEIELKATATALQDANGAPLAADEVGAGLLDLSVRP